MIENKGISNGSRTQLDSSTLMQNIGNSTLIERQKAVKLPVSDLPKFDGNFEN